MPHKLWNSKAISSYIEKLFKNGKVYLLEQPTGSGKSTLAATLSLLLYRKANIRSFIFVRTHDQVWEYVDRILELSRYLGFNALRVVPLVGKDVGCMYGYYKFPYIAYAYCRSQGNGELCKDKMLISEKDPLPIYHELSKSSSDLHDVIGELAGLGYCPYYTLKYLALNGHIIIGTYSHMKANDIFSLSDPYRYAIFIDEAHNIVDFLLDSRIRLIYESKLEELQLIFRKYGFNNIAEKIRAFLDLTKEVSVVKNLFFQKILSEKLLDISLAINNVIGEKRGYTSDVYYMLNEVKNNNGLETTFENLVHLMSMPPKIIRKKEDKILLEYPSIPKSLARAINSSLSTILMSATLSPLAFYRRILIGIGVVKEVDIINDEPLFDPFSNMDVNIKLIDGFTSKYEERSYAQLRDIAIFTLDVYKKTGWHTFVFFPSKELSLRFYSMIVNLNGGHEVYILDSFPNIKSQNLSSSGAKIFISTQRSRVSEGVNYFRLENYPVNVIIYGLSIRPKTAEYDMKLRTLLKLKSSELLHFGYLVPAVNFLIQVFGRFIMSGRKINLYILEKRLIALLKNEGFLPKWFVDLLYSNGYKF